MEIKTFQFTVGPEESGQRLDVFLARKLENYSRAVVQRSIIEDLVLVDDLARKQRYHVSTGEKILITVIPAEQPTLEPEDIPLDILYEDEHLMVINKQPGLVVHPAAGNFSHTLVNALLHHCKELISAGSHPLRPGIVHRLDKDTSGCMVVAKTDAIHRKLAAMFANRKMVKEYRALVFGHFDQSYGSVNTYIDRSRRDRKTMAVSLLKGKRALTHFEVLEQYAIGAYLRLIIETGRTHQIRVHLTHIGHPVMGDLQYRRKGLPDLGVRVRRQMLHAYALTFTHPETGATMAMKAPLPDDFTTLMKHLSGDNIR